MQALIIWARTDTRELPAVAAQLAMEANGWGTPLAKMSMVETIDPSVYRGHNQFALEQEARPVFHRVATTKTQV